ncbi:MAG TPA: VPLPA-CTERM-specific exosortase XrtD, partial [Burkholderiales bacterium]|nr:VPLPA-CTERM-specific exosortase XrtD [Burkholderiales bacterium]
MQSEQSTSLVTWRETPQTWALLALLAIFLGFIFSDGLRELWRVWDQREEYSYGYVVPFITLFLLWQRKDELQQLPFRGSWAGTVLVLFGLALFFLGELSTLYLIIQYSLLIVLLGMALAYVGWRGLRVMLVPLLFLVFMIPLPQFFQQEISAGLQLLSSQIGVGVIRLFGIPVFLEGNVIDLGDYKLQVVEACNGLRYLFPLMTLGFLCAYLFRAPWWARAVVFLSTIPITVIMNSFRIGVIGVLVEYWGASMAEGFLHDFEGWVVFMVCIGALLAEMWLLTKLLDHRRSFTEAFLLEFPRNLSNSAESRKRSASRPYIAALVLVGIATVAASLLGMRAEVAPPRMSFGGFPTQLEQWRGRVERIDPIYLDQLKLTDYVMHDYRIDGQPPVNLYIAYYDSQRKGESSHSPRTCIPGGGWRINSITPRVLDGVQAAGLPLAVNRTEIQRGSERMLVYYWFQQRGRILTNEYAVKWYIFQDALTQNRTDGAMLRLTTVLAQSEDWQQADDRLHRLAGLVTPTL